jgi:hypothetical protein
MNDNGFDELQASLDEAIRFVWELKDIYKEQTGCNYISPLRVPEYWIEAQRQLDRDESRNRAKPSRASSFDMQSDGSRRM